MPPRLAIVSTGIRRDLLAPLRYFTEFEIIHFYRRAEYGDLTKDDLSPNLGQYSSPLDLYRQLATIRPDIIQGVEPFSMALQPYLWACFVAARKTRAKLLAVTLENRPLQVKFGQLNSFLLRRILNFYFSRTCFVIALNQGAKRNLVSCGVPPAKIERMMWGTWGIDLDEFCPIPSNDRPAIVPDHPEDPTILYAGRSHAEKGIFVLLDAFNLVLAKLPSARLKLVGGGPAANELTARIQALGMNERVEMVGPVKNRAMPGIFRTSTVFAAPSITTRKWEEQVGMSAIQAMACGVPVVATKSGAIPEYVPDRIAGILVPERDPTSLARALLELLTDNSLRGKMALSARQYACDHYNARENVRHAEIIVKERCLAGSL